MTFTEIQITEWHSQNERITSDMSDSDGEDAPNKYANECLKIYMFGKTLEGKNVSVIVNGFPCFFYLSLPVQWMINGKINKGRVKIFVDTLLSRLRQSDKDAFIKYEICNRKRFRGFTNNTKYPFLRLSFQNSRAMRNCSEIFIKKNTVKGNVISSIAKNGITRISTPQCNLKEIKTGDKIQLSTRDYSKMGVIPKSILEIIQINNVGTSKTEITVKNEMEIPDDIEVIWSMIKNDGDSVIKKPIYYIPGLMYNKSERVELFESNIDPMLRFLHIKNLNPCGWIKVPSITEQPSENTESDLEYLVDWKEVIKSDNQHNNPIKTLAFDIECGSSHGDFPNAIKGYTKLAKELLELPMSKINPEYIKTILEAIPNNDIKNIHRIYLKKQQLFSEETINYLSNVITRYLWLNKQANKYRLNGNLEFTKDELLGLLYLEDISDKDFKEELPNICDIIPTLSISPK